MVVTSPSPSASAAPPAAAPGRPHPTYTNMITYALAQLGGASGRSAIAGFIAACFTGLPVSHDALLSAHLRRLVAEGVLCTSGFSYFFSSDEPIDSATRSLDLDSDDQSGSGFILSTSSSDDDDDDAAYTPLMPVTTSLLGEKRGRGRPRKNVEVSPANAGGVRRGRGRPRKVVVTMSGSGSGSGSGESMSPQPFAAKGEPTEHSVLSGDVVTKPGRGRPRKKLQQVGDPSTGGGGGGGIIIKRGPTKEEDQQSQEAKPPPTPTALSTGGVKTEQQSEEEEAAAAAAAAQHPPTPLSTGDAPETGAATPAEETGGAASTGIKRGRGRPRKEKPAAAAMSAQAGDAGSAGIKRGRGRPRKEKPAAAAAMLAETEAGGAVSTGMKGALENPISVYAVSTGTNGALENPRTEAGGIVSMVMKRGRGRPRKEQPAFD